MEEHWEATTGLSGLALAVLALVAGGCSGASGDGMQGGVVGPEGAAPAADATPSPGNPGGATDAIGDTQSTRGAGPVASDAPMIDDDTAGGAAGAQATPATGATPGDQAAGAMGEPTAPATAGGALPRHWHEVRSFGTDTMGGLSGQVCRVTNLNASGEGSFRNCVSAGNRLVVFEVGGVIDLDGDGISIDTNNVTVAGQTAPSPGITLLRGNFSADGSDIVVSHIAVQLGDGVSGYPDASNIRGDRIIFDHVSVFWGMDETLSIHGTSDVTLYKCLIAEGLQFTGHEDGEHSKGSLINNGTRNLALVGTMYAHNALRTPRVDGGEIFIANDIVYNWGPGWDHQGDRVFSDEELPGCRQCFNLVVSARSDCNVTMVDSVAIQGPESLAEHFLAGHNGSANGYVDANVIIDPAGNPLSEVDQSDITLLDSPATWPEGFERMPADQGLYEGLRTVGPRPGDRDAHHARVVENVAAGDGAIIDSQDEVGGYPNHAPTARPIDSVPGGAEARQAWLDELEDEIAVDLAIDLSRLYGLVGSEASDKLK